jgi:putative hydrolase of the HAD superfamily
VSLGFIPRAERLSLPPRKPLPWASLPAGADLPAKAGSHAQRGLILDLDDTLYPHERFVRSGFAAVARHLAATHGVSAEMAFGVLARAREAGRHGHELQILCDRFALPRDLAPALLEVYRRHMPSIWLHHGVAEVLQQLRAAGWRLGVLTNGLPSVQFRKVAALGLSLLVDEIVYAEEYAPGGKPAPAAFRAVLRSLDLAPENCIVVGDDPLRDVRGARALGMRTIRVARPDVAVTAGDDADMVIDTLASLPVAAAGLLDMVAANVA